MCIDLAPYRYSETDDDIESDDEKDEAVREVVELISTTWSREECHRQYMLLADHVGDWLAVYRLLKGKSVDKSKEKDPSKRKEPVKEKRKTAEVAEADRDPDFTEEEPAPKKMKSTSRQSGKSAPFSPIGDFSLMRCS